MAAGSCFAVTADEVKIHLSGQDEVPPVATSASGGGTITIKDDKTISGSVSTSGIKGTVAHIHVGAPGNNGPVMLPLTRKGDSDWQVPMGAKLTDEQYKDFKAGKLYVNVHSDAHKNGEIRGPLAP